MHDSFSKAQLNKNGVKQAEEISSYLEEANKTDDIVVIVSPLVRTFQTITPYLQKLYGKEFDAIQKKYQDIQKIYQDLRNQKDIQSYMQDTSKQNIFEIKENLYVDFRMTDIIIPQLQDKPWIKGITISKPTNEKLTPEGESMDDVNARCHAYTQEVNKRFATKTIVTITHKDSVILIQKAFKDFDYLTKKYDYSPDNGQIVVRYRDNERNREMDLHKPYVDTYRFKQ